MRKYTTAVLSASALLVLTACGGGGSGGGGGGGGSDVSDLFGNVELEFNNSGERGSYFAGFSEDTTEFEPELGELFTTDTGAILQLNSGGTSVEEMSCAFLAEAENSYICIATVGGTISGALSVALLKKTSSTRFDGNFEFCPPSISYERCGNEVVVSPDGPATLTVSPFNTRTKPTQFDMIDNSAYMEYANQGSIDSSTNTGMTSTGVLVTKAIQQFKF